MRFLGFDRFFRQVRLTLQNRAFPALLAFAVAAAAFLSACQAVQSPAAQSSGPKVLAVESFLADIAQNVAGERAVVESLIPAGVDPHAFEPTPRDIAAISHSDLLIVNGAGLEQWLERTLKAAGGSRLTVEASAGLASRTPKAGELAVLEDGHDQGAVDPHFWLDPLNVVRYVENIRDGLIQVDPQGKEVYTQNAAGYIEKLKELDSWISEEVQQIPPERRQIITNHESFGYYADRYGFTITGTIIPSVSSSASPSAQQLARLVDTIRAAHAPAVFLETGSSSQLAGQVAQETGIKVVTGLYTHSITDAAGEAPSYLEMMRANTEKFVAALK